jgi:TRAP-type transport system periplasmic protein
MKLFTSVIPVLICLTLSFGAPFVSAQTFTWDMANEYAATNIQSQIDVFFIQTLEKLSKGQIKITHHPGAALGYKSKDQYDAVTDGALPLASTFIGALRGINPMFMLSTLPSITKNLDQAKILSAVSAPYYEKVLKGSNQILLYDSPWPPSGIWANKAIRSNEDLRNLKIRTFDPNGTITFKNAGATPIQLSWSDVVPQLGTGGINAVLTSAETGVSSKFWDLLKCFTEINYSSGVNIIHMNAAVFNKLPEELRNAVKEAAVMAKERAWRLTYERIAQHYKDMKDHGVAVVTDVPEQLLDNLSQSGKPAVDEWLTKMGADGEAILKEYHARISK